MPAFLNAKRFVCSDIADIVVLIFAIVFDFSESSVTTFDETFTLSSIS